MPCDVHAPLHPGDLPAGLAQQETQRGDARPRILLVDDQPAVRESLALFLEAAGVGRCCEAGSRAEALAIIDGDEPDAALLDISPEDGSALLLLEELRARRIPVLVCARHECASFASRVTVAGASGYLTSEEVPQHVAGAMRAVLEGWLLVSPRGAEQLGDEADDCPGSTRRGRRSRVHTGEWK